MTPIRPPWKDIPPSPHPQKRERILQVGAKIIKTHISQPAANKRREKSPRQEIAGIGGGHRVRRPLDKFSDIEPRQHATGDPQ